MFVRKLRYKVARKKRLAYEKHLFRSWKYEVCYKKLYNFSWKLTWIKRVLLPKNCEFVKKEKLFDVSWKSYWFAKILYSPKELKKKKSNSFFSNFM
jgi:hypothetical protein